MFAAVSAYDQAGKRIPPGVAPVRRYILCGPPCNFGLNRFVFLHAYDGLVRSLRMVHRELAIVDHRLLCQVVFPEGLLKEQVPGIGVIPENAADAGFAPCSAVSGFYTVCVQALGNGDDAFARKELPKNSPDRFGLVRFDDVDAVSVAVAEERFIPRLALLEIFAHTPFLIFAGRKARLLCVGRKDRKHQLPIRGKGVDVLFLEKDVNAEGLQIPDSFQKRDRIPGKAGYGFGDDHSLSEFPVVVRYNSAVDIIRKVREKAAAFLKDEVSPISPFAIPTKVTGEARPTARCNITLYTSRGVGYINKSEILSNIKYLDRYKVMVSQIGAEHAGEPGRDGKFRVLTSSMRVMQPNEVCTNSYIVIGEYTDPDTANNVLAYLKTKFVRFLVLQAVSSIHISRTSFTFVPMVDFSKQWTDEELYAEFGITPEEIEFIDSMIKPMDGGDE